MIINDGDGDGHDDADIMLITGTKRCRLLVE